jgi:hypothetical protein
MKADLQLKDLEPLQESRLDKCEKKIITLVREFIEQNGDKA